MISHEALTDALHGMFELAPTAFCISTADPLDSRYVKVNPAYLRLIGRTWDEIKEEQLNIVGSVVSPARARRMHLLDTVGFYKLEEVDLRHSSGRIVPTLISCQRRIVGGETVDVEIIIDNSERKSLERKIRKAAFTDTITGLPNRASFDMTLAARIAKRPAGKGIGLAFIDLNGFKRVNDVHGHAVGDALLKIVARRLRQRSRAGDFIARLGGDEFAVLFEFRIGRESEAAGRLYATATEICSQIMIGDTEIEIGAAVGVATATELTTPEIILQSADKLMYVAKRTRQRVAVRIAA